MTDTAVEVDFFRLLFDEQPGYICLAIESAIKGDFKQFFFEWPKQKQELWEFVVRHRDDKNVWFCVNLLNERKRRKESCVDTNLVWSDLDEASPDDLNPPPAIVIESSPGRFQAIWRIDQELDAYVAEDYSRRLAYFYADNGADPSGWDLTQLLRVPDTYNLKYHNKPDVKLLRWSEATLPVAFFEALPEIVREGDVKVADAPDLDSLPSPEQIIKKHYTALRQVNFADRWMHEPEPEDDWSGQLWALIKTCLESGLSAEETFVLAVNSKYNKYDRDRRPNKYMWRDVRKAQVDVDVFHGIISTGALEMPELIPGQNYGTLEPSFIDEYREWGMVATDAPAQYHDLSAFVLLSSLLAGAIKLDTSYGSVRPNIWGLVLGDTTLTRKSTAMRLAIEMIGGIDQDIIVASEGSMEGILGELSTRPSLTSMFFRDEVTGFFESARKKDYQAGMVEVMTQLYDVPYVFTRRLRKETISVREPVFIFFGGGIKEKLLMVTDDSYIYSGFLPRFLIVSSTTDLNLIRKTGPSTVDAVEQRQAIFSKLHDWYKLYTDITDVQILGQEARPEVQVEAILSPEAWEVYGEIEMRLLEFAADSSHAGIALPTFDRLSRSMLKMSLLVAAIRQKPEQGMIQVTDTDLLHAAKYVQHWGNYSIELISNIGRTVLVRVLEKVLNTIKLNPGINRGQVMRLTNLSKREMTEVEETLEERQQIIVTKSKQGGGRMYTAI